MPFEQRGARAEGKRSPGLPYCLSYWLCGC